MTDQQLSKLCPKCHQPAVLPAGFCGNCGHRFDASPAASDATVPDQAVVVSPASRRAAPSPALPPWTAQKTVRPDNIPSYLAVSCVLCGNMEPLQVCALYQAQAPAADQQDDGSGEADQMAAKQAVPNGETEAGGGPDMAKLTRLLAPPQAPPDDPENSVLLPTVVGTVGIGLMVLCGLLLLQPFFHSPHYPGPAYSGNTSMALAGLLFGAACFAVFAWTLSHTRHDFEARKRFLQAERRRWHRSMRIWERLYYCPLCNRVYDPLTHCAEAPERMWKLLAFF